MQAQDRHKPRAPQRRTKKVQPLAQVKIDSEPAPSERDDGWFYFYVEHLNTRRDNWSVLCREDQVGWVLKQKEDNIQLLEGTHFSDQRLKTENGYATRSILSEEFYLEEPEPEEPPALWEVAPLSQDNTPPADPEVMRRIDTWLRVLAELGVEPTPDRIAETAAGFCTSVEIGRERRGQR